KVNMVQFHKEGGYRRWNNSDLRVMGRAVINPLKHVSVNLDFTSNIKNIEGVEYLATINSYNGGQPVTIYNTAPDRVSRSNNSYLYNAFNSYLTYDNAFGLHNIMGMIGFNQEKIINKDILSQREGLAVGSIPFTSLATGNQIT